MSVSRWDDLLWSAQLDNCRTLKIGTISKGLDLLEWSGTWQFIVYVERVWPSMLFSSKLYENIFIKYRNLFCTRVSRM